MTLFGLFKRRGSAPLARERLQILLAHERRNRNQPDFLGVLREEIMAVVTKYVRVDQNHVHVTMERGDRMSKLDIGIRLPHAGYASAVAH
jgi:cell division topological specificity factor